MIRVVRNRNGSMIVLVILAVGLVIAAGLLGVSLSTFFSQKTLSQHKVDSIALSYASRINAGDRVGQMNELVERSRELAYLSRRSFARCAEPDRGFLSPLAHRLVCEAYEGHELVERERKNQINLISTEMQQAAQKHNREAASGVAAYLGFNMHEPVVTRIALGNIQNAKSNVRMLDVLDELVQSDRQRGYFAPGSNIFRGNINAKLPDCGDGELDFRFAALPACVEGVSSPARNANSGMFMSYGTILSYGKKLEPKFDYTPSAVHVFCNVDVSVNGNSSAPVQLSSTGVASGACFEQD